MAKRQAAPAKNAPSKKGSSGPSSDFMYDMVPTKSEKPSRKKK
jgi:hypothetical protein